MQSSAEYELPVHVEPSTTDTIAPYACCFSSGTFQKDDSSKKFTYGEFYVGTKEQIAAASDQAERKTLGEFTEP